MHRKRLLSQFRLAAVLLVTLTCVPCWAQFGFGGGGGGGLGGGGGFAGGVKIDTEGLVAPRFVTSLDQTHSPYSSCLPPQSSGPLPCL